MLFHLPLHGYGPKPSKSVSEDTSNEVRESPHASLVEELVSDDKLEKTVLPTVAKKEFVRPKQQEKLVRKPVKYAEMYRLTTITIKGKEWNMVPRAVLIKTGLRSVNTARPVNAIKASARWVWRPTKLNSASITLKKHNYVDAQGRSKGGAKGGKINGKGTLKTGKLDFTDMYFVKEFQFNLFSVSQMYGKNNSVLFTETGCFVLSPDFKLDNESQ
ncbi:hypothetical protein Tco_0158593, partial [Tanacetum coccineum]